MSAIYRDDVEVNAASGGENLRLRLAGIEDDELQAGFIICSRNVPVPCVTYFQAQLQASSSCSSGLMMHPHFPNSSTTFVMLLKGTLFGTSFMAWRSAVCNLRG